MPAETSEFEVLINNDPFETFGTGTSATSVEPFFKDCRIYFIIIIFQNIYLKYVQLYFS